MVPSLLEKHKGKYFWRCCSLFVLQSKLCSDYLETVQCVCVMRCGAEKVQQKEGICVAMLSAPTLLKGKLVRSRGWRMMGRQGVSHSWLWPPEAVSMWIRALPDWNRKCGCGILFSSALEHIVAALIGWRGRFYAEISMALSLFFFFFLFLSTGTCLLNENFSWGSSL